MLLSEFIIQQPQPPPAPALLSPLAGTLEEGPPVPSKRHEQADDRLDDTRDHGLF